MSSRPSIVHRFRRWVVVAIAFGALLYLALGAWADLGRLGDELGSFNWALAVPVLALTLLNYGLRFAKWHYLLGRLGVHMPVADDAWNFAAGLAMVISPGKAGEVLKPYVVRARTGAPMATTIPALVTERLTDGIAMLILAGLGVTTFAADRLHYVAIPAAVTVLGLAVLAHEGLSLWCVGLVARVPGVGRAAPKLVEMLGSMRTCVAPWPLMLTIGVSMVAWGAECVGFWLVFDGVGAQASLFVSTFLYAFATVAGGAMPGGLGVADGALFGGAMALIPGISEPQALAAALLIRTATLWFGVGLGALALFRVSGMLAVDGVDATEVLPEADGGRA